MMLEKNYSLPCTKYRENLHYIAICDKLPDMKWFMLGRHCDWPDRMSGKKYSYCYFLFTAVYVHHWWPWRANTCSIIQLLTAPFHVLVHVSKHNTPAGYDSRVWRVVPVESWQTLTPEQNGWHFADKLTNSFWFRFHCICSRETNWQ